MAPDPLDVLRGLDEPVAPARAFASSLRTRLADLLGVPDGGTMSDTATVPTATGLRLRPYLVVDGADAAIAFYGSVFGARVVGDLVRGDDGRVGHAELDLGGSGFYLADAYPELGIPAPDPAVGVSMHLEVADADATVARAAEHGATVLQAVEDRFYGSRSGTVRDPFGHQWQIDAPGAASNTQADRDRELEESQFAWETVDLGEHAPADRPAPAAATPALAPSIGYFTVDVPDGPRAAAFYGALLGWSPRVGSQPGGFHVENIAPPGGIAGGADGPSITVYFRVPELAPYVARVRELGGEVLTEDVYPSGGSATCRDDQGVTFMLWQPAPGY